MVNVHEFLFADGTSLGCGTALELAYWQSEGIIDPEAKLGKVICTEPASEDERRKSLWGIGDFMDKVPE
jgi:hypothetical protein